MPDTAARVQRELFLRAFFEASPPKELAELLADRMKDRYFEPGGTLYEQGQPPGSIFFLTEGMVELTLEGERPWVFEDRAFLGAIDANMGQPHPRTARAKTRVKAIEIHFEEYLAVLEEFFDFAKEVLVRGARATHEREMELAPYDALPPPRRAVGRWLDFARLDEVQRVMILRDSAPFHRAPVQALVNLAGHATVERFSPGETILHEEDISHGIHLLADGLAKVTCENPILRSQVGPGDLLLGPGNLVPRPHPFGVSAETNAIVFCIPHEDLFDAMEEHMGVTRSWWAYMGKENRRIHEVGARRGRSTREDDVQLATSPRTEGEQDVDIGHR